MANTDENRFVCGFFNKFAERVARLPKLHSDSYSEEAFTLCIVYVDRLASGYYGGEAGRNRENFCRALKELSGNSLFGMLHPRELSEQVKKYFPDAVTVIASIARSQPHALLDEAAVAGAIRSSGLESSRKQKLIEHLWRASIASICYGEIRGPEVHGVGSGGLDFDESVYNGKVGFQIDFELVYEAVSKIFEHIRRESAQTGHWFGNPNYPAARP